MRRPTHDNRKKHPLMLDVGIVGLGPAWEPRYRSALLRLNDRIRVRAIYDPIRGRAEQAAAEFRAVCCQGLLSTISLSRVQAILLLDHAWYRDAALSILINNNKPAFVADFSTFAPQARFAGDSLRSNHTPMLIPALELRYEPAICRLRELMATRLGAVTEIEIDLPSDTRELQSNRALTAACDLCGYLVATPPTHIRPIKPDCVEVRFKQSRRVSEAAIVRLRLLGSADGSSVAPAAKPNADALTIRVNCQRGSAVLAADNTITWTHAESTRIECLDEERSETEVLLDLFCRRMHGGLIPVPTPGDAARAAATAAAIESCRRTGEPHRL